VVFGFINTIIYYDYTKVLTGAVQFSVLIVGFFFIYDRGCGFKLDGKSYGGSFEYNDPSAEEAFKFGDPTTSSILLVNAS
jgi:hypothetical protein